MSKIFKEAQVEMDEVYNIAVMPHFIQSAIPIEDDIDIEDKKLDKEIDSETDMERPKEIGIDADKQRKIDLYLKKQYDDFMSNMEKEKDEIIKEAIQESEQIKRSAYSDGKAKGYNDGKEQAEHDYRQGLTELNEIKAEVIKEREHLCDTLEGDIVNLIIKICEKVFYEDAFKLKDVISDRVSEVLKEINSVKDITIRVNHEDIDYLSALKDKFKEENLVILPDYKLQSGDFVIETPNGLIDYSMIRVLKNIKDTLIEVLKNDRA